MSAHATKIEDLERAGEKIITEVALALQREYTRVIVQAEINEQVSKVRKELEELLSKIK